MKPFYITFLLLLTLLFQNFIFAQGEAAVPFLLLQPSPSLSAMGQTGTALPTDDTFAFLWNPAQLGNSSQNSNFSYSFYPREINWLPTLNLKIKSSAFNLGYNFKKHLGFPVSIGLGYSEFKLDYGSFIRTDPGSPEPIGTFSSWDYYNAYSFGVGIDYIFQINFGFNIKQVTSFAVDAPTNEDTLDVKAKTTVKDYGILINIPIIRLIDDKMNIQLSEKLFAYPSFNFSFGYSKSNIGDRIYYIDPKQSDPLPRIERLGYGISAGIDLVTEDLRLNAFNLFFTVEADDILISRRGFSPPIWEYQDDLNFWDNVILIKGNDKIVSHVGTKLYFFETFAYSFGHFSGRGFDLRKTNGYELNSKGILKQLSSWLNHPYVDFLKEHFEIRYYNTIFFAGDELQTKMKSVSLHLTNIHKLF